MNGAFYSRGWVATPDPNRDANHFEVVDWLVKRRLAGIEGFY
jgi:hypothetical protein